MFNREVLLPKKSFILLGPRQTGKSTLIRSLIDTRTSWVVDLLEGESFIRYSQSPALFRREAEYKISREKVSVIVVDEIQRVPPLLNEVQSLMASTKCQFMLTGSSARKLKRGHANLLGARLAERHLFPLTFKEIGSSFDLEESLCYGTLPAVVGRSGAEQRDILAAYVNLYLREEIKSEGLSRNIGGFSRFLDIAASQSGELVSFSAVARECGLPVRTVQSYYEILEDTLIGFRLDAWSRSARKRLVAHPKFYFFDTGVVNAINKRLTARPDRVARGRLFEQWVVLETYRAIHYSNSEANLFFWRTNHGAEVDLLIEKHGKIIAAVEVKSSARISGADLSGLRAFRQEHPRTNCQVVCCADESYELDGVHITPWERYLNQLTDCL